MPKRVGILGTFVWDTIWTLEDQAAGRPFESWGGVAYSLAAGAAALPRGWEIVPIAKVGADLLGEAHRYLDTLGGIGPRAGLVRVAQANNRVELRYLDAERRGERLTGCVPGWTWEELAPVLEGLDALYLNYFSGWETDLETARRIAREFRGPVYADLHSLFLGPPGEGPREPRPLPDWEEWLACFDVVQLNEDERRLLGASTDPRSVPAELLRHGPDAVLVTLGPAGAVYAARPYADSRPGLRGGPRLEDGGGRVLARRVDGGDPTGCGDAWGAAVFAGLLGGLSLEHAVTRATALAAAKMGHRGATGLYRHLRRTADAWARSPIDAPP